MTKENRPAGNGADRELRQASQRFSCDPNSPASNGKPPDPRVSPQPQVPAVEPAAIAKPRRPAAARRPGLMWQLQPGATR